MAYGYGCLRCGTFVTTGKCPTCARNDALEESNRLAADALRQQGEHNRKMEQQAQREQQSYQPSAMSDDELVRRVSQQMAADTRKHLETEMHLATGRKALAEAAPETISEETLTCPHTSCRYHGAMIITNDQFNVYRYTWLYVTAIIWFIFFKINQTIDNIFYQAFKWMVPMFLFGIFALAITSIKGPRRLRSYRCPCCQRPVKNH